MDYQVRNAIGEDGSAIYELYRIVSKDAGGIAREEEEITMEYISGNLKKHWKTDFVW